MEVKGYVEKIIFSSNDNGHTILEISLSSEEVKMNVVNTLVESAEYLSERKIGGLIVIERSDSLDSFINKAIYPLFDSLGKVDTVPTIE